MSHSAFTPLNTAARAVSTVQGQRWVIKRNCSASPLTLAVVLGSIVIVSFVFGVAFAVHGLWLVLPFVGLELMAVSTAFFCYGRHAGDIEYIELKEDQIQVDRLDGMRRFHWQANAFWTRVELEEKTVTPRAVPRVYLHSGGQRIEVGRHLLPLRRRVLARELKQALSRS